jgi:hypothetical protein
MGTTDLNGIPGATPWIIISESFARLIRMAEVSYIYAIKRFHTFIKCIQTPVTFPKIACSLATCVLLEPGLPASAWH